MPPLRFAPGERVVAHADQAGGQFQECALTPIAFGPGVGGEWFPADAIRADAGQRRCETSAFRRIRRRLAVDDEAADAIAAAECAECLDLRLHPRRARRRRRTDDDQGRRLGQGCTDRGAEVASGRQFVAVAEDRAQARADRPIGAGRAHQARRHAIRLQPAMQPLGPRGIGMAVAEEGGVAHGCRSRGRDSP